MQPPRPLRVALFGATGTAGGSVLKVCLDAPVVREVRAIVRRPPPRRHDKLVVVPHQDFSDLSAVRSVLEGIDACLYCVGISVTQVSGETEYRRVTHDLAVAAAGAVRDASPGATFHFISGEGARLDSRVMWARVKAETERDLIALVAAVCWRPGYIDGEMSASAPRMYRLIQPAMRLLSPIKRLYVRGEDIGRAMLQATLDGVRGRVIGNAEIRALAARARLDDRSGS